MSILIFLLILSVLVFVHELGHFLFAKWCGIRVDSFALGFPPTLWKKKVGETTYKLNALPLGGYVSIYGENYENLDPTDKDFGRSFAIKKWWQQFIVLIGGILFNMIFALLLLVLIGWTSAMYTPVDVPAGEPRPDDVALIIANVLPDSPADQAGIAAGSIIESINGQENTSIDETINIIKTTEDNIALTIEGLEKPIILDTIEIITDDGTSHQIIGTGLAYGRLEHQGFWGGIKNGWHRTVDMTAAVATGLRQLITGDASIDDLTGPVGLTGVVAEAQKRGFADIVFLTAFISINLALLNLLPFPALDGGRIVFVIIEAITNKRIPAKIGQWVNSIGFILLMILMVVVTVKDVVGLF